MRLTPLLLAFASLIASIQVVSGAAPDSYGGRGPFNANSITSGTLSDARLNSDVTRNLYLSTLPVILPSSGTIGSNGALSGITALPTTYANCYMFFPAGAIVSGSAAGIYFVQMSSATAGTVYNNPYTSGVPAVPAQKTAFSGTGVSYTQVTSAVTMQQYVMPGNTMGSTDGIRIQATETQNNSANNRTYLIKIDSTTLRSLSITASLTNHDGVELYTRGSLLSEVSSNGTFGGGSTYWSTTNNAVVWPTLDMSVAQTIAVTGQLANASDFEIYEMVRVDHL